MRRILYCIAIFFTFFNCNAQQPKLILPVGHTAAINAVNFSPDSKYIVTAGDDNTAKLWEAASGKLLFSFSGHTNIISGVNFSRDGKLIVTASWDSTAAIWDAATGQLLHFLTGHSDVVSFADFSPDGKYIVTASWDKTAKIWETSSGKLLNTFVGHKDRLSYAGFSHDGKFIVTKYSTNNLTADSSAKIWDAAKGKLLTDFSRSFFYRKVIISNPKDSVVTFNSERHHGFKYYQMIDSARVSPDGKFVVTAFKDSTVKLWETSSGKLIYNLTSPVKKVRSASFSQDGNWVIAVFNDSTARIWGTFSGILMADISNFRGNADAVNFSTDGKFMLFQADKRTVNIIATFTGKIVQNIRTSPGIITLPKFGVNGNQVIIGLDDHTVETRELLSGRLLHKLELPADVNNADFSADGKYIFTEYGNIIKVWDAVNGELLDNMKEYLSPSGIFSTDRKYIIANNDNPRSSTKINSVLFETEGFYNAKFVGNVDRNDKNVVTKNGDSIPVPDISKGYLLFNQKGFGEPACICFSPDRKYVAIARGGYAKVWNAMDGIFLYDLVGHTNSVYTTAFSSDGRFCITSCADDRARVWDVPTGKLLYTLYQRLVYAAKFSPDDKYIITNSRYGGIKIWNTSSGDSVFSLNAETALFSPDAKYLAAGCRGDSLKIIAVKKWQTLHIVKGVLNFTVLNFSQDGKTFITTDRLGGNHYIINWESATGKLLDSIEAHATLSANYSPDGKYIVTGAYSGLQMWDIPARKPIINPHQYRGPTFFSADGKYFAVSSDSNDLKVFETAAQKVIATLRGYYGAVQSAEFSPDGKYIVTLSYTNRSFNFSAVKVFEIATGALVHTLTSHTAVVNAAKFSPDGKYIVTASADNTIKTWNAFTGNLVYTLIPVDTADYLVIDPAGHFDGTAEARKFLYFTCGREIIEIQQLKDKLWVPGLAERIYKGEAIDEMSLAGLGICELIPTVEQTENESSYQFMITPRLGGLGETILYVNGIETVKFNPASLKKVGGRYELLIQKHDLRRYFAEGQQNIVTVKAYTKENDISSRGTRISNNSTSKETSPPNLYAVVIGVSDYKGEDLDLKYAAKDAADFSNAVSLSAGKLLGKEHVFMYDITTAEKHYLLPEKENIKKVFTEIGKKATANDILLIFFAGHGVVVGDKKQFYFLTSNASGSSITATGIRDVGVSAAELMDWMKPATIKAQKRILILDACQSGSAIQQMVSIGNNQAYLAARNDDKAEEIKQIDKLNEKAGLYILAASASDQSAYEMARYSQGLLTYALLKAIKEHPEVLDQNKFLNVSGWFNEAKKIVDDIVMESKLQQQPQLITTNDFIIGVVDREVLAKIILPGEKPLFAESNFQNNDDSIIDDDLDLGRYINTSLSYTSSGGANTINYVMGTNSTDAWSLTGRYKVKNDTVTVTVNVKQNKMLLDRFEITGNTDNIQQLAELITNESIKRILKR